MHILDVVFPKRCVGCGKIGKYFCARCALMIRIIRVNEAICPICEKPAVDGVTHPRCRTRYSMNGLTSFFRYEGAVREAVKAIKYRYVSDMAAEFISLIPESSLFSLAKLVNTKPLSPLLIPIPLHPTRLRFRGFNQAEELGKLLATRLTTPMRTDILRRTKETVPQVEMKDRRKRLKNMEDVFSSHNSQFIIRDSSILLFDDVFTTGATMRSAANVLKRAGVAFVWGVTMAR